MYNKATKGEMVMAFASAKITVFTTLVAFRWLFTYITGRLWFGGVPDIDIEKHTMSVCRQ